MIFILWSAHFVHLHFHKPFCRLMYSPSISLPEPCDLPIQYYGQLGRGQYFKLGIFSCVAFLQFVRNSRKLKGILSRKVQQRPLKILRSFHLCPGGLGSDRAHVTWKQEINQSVSLVIVRCASCDLFDCVIILGCCYSNGCIGNYQWRSLHCTVWSLRILQPSCTGASHNAPWISAKRSCSTSVWKCLGTRAATRCIS